MSVDKTPSETRSNHNWRGKVGGLWNEIGILQFEFMRSQGMQPYHKLLDVGCGCLRGGVHFVKYLNDGHYYGIDKNSELLDRGRDAELTLAGLENRTIHLICNDLFQFSEFNTDFDFAIAQSVFTHLPWDSILRCLTEIKTVLSTEGRFYATFFEDREGKHLFEPLVHQPGGIWTYSDKDPFHYTFSAFTQMAAKVDLAVELIGNWNHPRNQQMMVFTHG